MSRTVAPASAIAGGFRCRRLSTLICRGSPASSPSRFQGRTRPLRADPDEHHDHLIDIRTGKVIEFRTRIEAIQQLIAKRLALASSTTLEL